MKKLLAFFLFLMPMMVCQVAMATDIEFLYREALKAGASSNAPGLKKRAQAFEFFYGINVRQDFSLALPRFKAAFSEGDSESGAIAGLMISAGLGSPKDPIKSRQIINEAYSRGSGLAAYLIAGEDNMKSPGNRVARDELLRFAVSRKVPEANFELASSLLAKSPSKKTSVRAKGMFSEGCELGDIRSCHSLGVMLYTDLYIPQNHSESLAILLMCADLGLEPCETAAGHVITRISRSDRDAAIKKAALYLENGYKSK